MMGQPLLFNQEVEMAMGRKVRADEAGELLMQWERSGETMSRWCAMRGLNRYSLSAYKGWRVTDLEAEVQFAEVLVDEPISTPALGRYRVVLCDVVVEVDDHFRDDTLQRLLRVVRTC